MVLALQPRGMGASAGRTAVSIGTSVGSAFVGGLIFGGPIAGAISAGIAAVVSAVGALLSRQGPAQKIATTNIVNQVAPLLQQNLDAWNASTKTCAEQAVCLANYDALWNQVVLNCANPSLGDPGHSCIDDRLPAGVQFEFNTFHLNGNGMYNWKAYYRDPIANDPAAQGCCPLDTCFFPNCSLPASSCVPAALDSVVNVPGVGSLSMSVLIPVLLLGVLVWVAS